MGSLEDDAQGIWRRIKKYIPVGRISGETRQEVLQNIEQYMRDNEGAGSGKSGSMERLVENGFATEEVLGRTKDFNDGLDEWLTGSPEDGGPVDAPEPDDLTKLPKLKMFSSGRASVQTGSGRRVFSQKNLRISFSEFKGKRSYYIYHVNMRKRLTWGVLNE